MESELLAEIQQLLQRLEAKPDSGSEAGDSITEISVTFSHLASHGRYCDIRIGGRISQIPVEPFRMRYEKTATLRVLEAIGRCSTLRSIHLDGPLTGDELEALLTPLQSNSVLERITVGSVRGDFTPEEATGAQRLYMMLERILQTSRTLKTLYLYDTRLNATCAYHLASGLRGNPDSALERLLISKRIKRTASVAKEIAEIVLSAPRLRSLILEELGMLDDDGLKALSKAFAQNTSLIALDLGGVTRGGSALLLEALTGEGSSRSITSLTLSGVIDGLGDCLPILLSSSQLQVLVIPAFEKQVLSPNQWRRLRESFCSNSSLERFQLSIDWTRSERDWNEELGQLLSAGMKKEKPVFDLRITTFRTVTADTSLADAVINNITSVQSLELDLWGFPMEQVTQAENIFKALRNDSKLQQLTIGVDGTFPSSALNHLFDSLRLNTTITVLNFRDCEDLDEDSFKELMGVLQVNFTLKTIHLRGSSWEYNGKAALIQEALRRNAELDSYFSILRRAELQFDRAKAGRLFLCGSPYAGKTELRRTMTRIVRGTSWLGNKAAQLFRTKGIEVELLIDDDQMQLAVWDLAGQWIFRTLQDILFPRTNQTCMFLFVFSVYDVEKGRIKDDLDQSFKNEFEEWLRFLSSNLLVKGQTLPKVLIAISHMDKMDVRTIIWAQIIVDQLRAEFQGVLDICSGEQLYQMDARKKKEVKLFKDSIVNIFGDLLQNKSPIVPKVCSKIHSLLAKRTKDIKHRPVWPSQDFYEFCFNSLKHEAKLLRPDDQSGLEVYQAMASYLHETGSIVTIPNSDWIIVDPNWLTNVFLGEVIALGQNFEASSNPIQMPQLVPFSSRSGFVSYSVLHRLLSLFVRKHLEIKDLNESMLEELLIRLDLCYKLDGGQVSAQYYIPTIVCEDTSFRGLDHRRKMVITRIEPLSWTCLSDSNQEFIGFRLQCENPKRMSMTAALFPRFQIYIRHKLMTEMNLTDDDVICSRNYMHLRMDGHEIFVESSDMTKSHIDVMVKCSKHKSRWTVGTYIQEHIIDQLRRFCASPKGCPGIALVVGILRMECVEKLVPLEHRGANQAILIEKLKENVEKYIVKQVEEMKPERSEDSSTLLNYEHSWPPIFKYLPSSFALARDLLTEGELETVTKKVLERHAHQISVLEKISEQMNDEMDQVKPVSNTVSKAGTASTALEVGDFGSSSTSPSSRSYRSQGTFERMLLSRFDRLEHKIDCLETTLRRIEKNMDGIITLHHQLQSSLSTFMSKVDKMIGYAESGERARTPKRPYVSFDNVSLFQRVTAAMRLGTPLRLHLMCESMTGPHIVTGQPGLKLCLERENMEWLRCIYQVSFKMMYFLVKAGLHVTLGLGQAVPELDSLEAALPLSLVSSAVDNISTSDSLVSLERSGNMTVTEAWNHLRSVLAPKLETNYTALFKLYRVKYFNGGAEEVGYAWVCDECMARGVRNRTCECL